jgi:hypothetical protein
VVLRAFFPLETEHAGVACSISVSGGGRNTSDMTEETLRALRRRANAKLSLRQ